MVRRPVIADELGRLVHVASPATYGAMVEMGSSHVYWTEQITPKPKAPAIPVDSAGPLQGFREKWHPKEQLFIITWVKQQYNEHRARDSPLPFKLDLSTLHRAYNRRFEGVVLDQDEEPRQPRRKRAILAWIHRDLELCQLCGWKVESRGPKLKSHYGNKLEQEEAESE